MDSMDSMNMWWWYAIHILLIVLLVFAIYLDTQKLKLLRIYIKSNEKISQLAQEMATEIFGHIARMQQELLEHLGDHAGHGDSTKP